MKIDQELLAELLTEVRDLKAQIAKVLEDRASPGYLPEVMSVPTAAKALDRSEKWVYRMIQRGELPVCAMPGGQYGISKKEIAAIQSSSSPRRLGSGRKPPRASGGRPKANGFDPKTESATLRAALRKRSKPEKD